MNALDALYALDACGWKATRMAQRVCRRFQVETATGLLWSRGDSGCGGGRGGRGCGGVAAYVPAHPANIRRLAPFLSAFQASAGS